MSRIASVALLLIVGPSMANAQARPRLRADVETVQTGCLWEKGDSSGNIRAIVTTGGVEHRLSKLWLDWILNPSDGDQAAKLVGSLAFTELNNAGSALELVTLAQVGSECEVVVDATDTHYDEPPTERWTLRLRYPGEGRVLRRQKLKAPR